MRKRGLFFRISVLLLTAVMLVAGIAFRAFVPDCGISAVHSLSDLEDLSITLDYAWEENASDCFDFPMSSEDPFGVDSAEIIAVVSPTGNIQQTEGSIGQEFVVKMVVRGDGLVSKDTVGTVYQSFGFRGESGSIEFINTLNLMYPENEYLIFMDTSPLNEYLDEPVYILHSDDFGYIKLNTAPTETLPDDYQNLDFSSLQNYEFFSVSEEVTTALNHARKEIQNAYLDGNNI